MRGYFITGTDTGIGKTVVAALLTLGLEANYWKPVQAGTAPSTDRADVAAWTGLPAARLAPETYRLQMPASPHFAAAAEGVRIELDRFPWPAGDPGAGGDARPWIVEGAGGVLVPLNERETMRDLMRHLGLPVILVAGPQLGTINHTLLSLEALRAAGLPVAGVILNGSAPAAGGRAALVATLTRFGNTTLLGDVPQLAALTPSGLRTAFTAHLAGRL